MQTPWIWYQLLLASQYVLQGTLYGLQIRYLPIILRKSGSSLLLVGSLNLLTFPWLLKSLWAPIIDIYGNRNNWLSLSYAGIALALLFAKAKSRIIFISSLVLLNLFSATVDLTLGKILITNFHGDELSKASSLQIIGYKVGFLIGGGLTLLIADIFSLNVEIFVALALFYFCLSLCYVTKPSVTPDVRYKPETCRYSLPDCTRMTGFARTPGLKWMIVCTCVYKFASHSSQSILTMFLVDNGESLSRIGFMSGMAGQVVSIAVASVCGVVLSAKGISPIQLLLLTSLLSVCSVMLQLYVVWWKNTTFIAFVYLLHNVVHGSQATPVYTLMLRCSQNAPPSIRTACYSFLGTLALS
ncbi:hypothetical protein ACROYT_G032599 [Oculina patagonica]